MPLEVSPPRTSRFGSPLALSRVHWVRPELVIEVKFFTWTDDNLLRQVVYEGLREDKPAAAVRRPTRIPPRRRALPFARGGRAAEVPGVTGPPIAANVSDVGPAASPRFSPPMCEGPLSKLGHRTPGKSGRTGFHPTELIRLASANDPNGAGTAVQWRSLR
jgi:hypothetical protein